MTSFQLGSKARLAGYRLRAFDTIGSTNAEALGAVALGDRGGLWFAALQQTAGRGRRGRPWQSPQGNLAASLLLIPDVDPSLAATLGFVAGIALNKCLASFLPDASIRLGLDGADNVSKTARIALKWPNDVLADGAKLAGILLEATSTHDGRQAIAIGLGVNVIAAPDGLPYPATSLKELGVHASAENVFEALSDAWVEAFSLWQDGQNVRGVLDQWRSVAAGVGASVAVSQDGKVLRGIFETIDETGRLIVLSDDEQRIAITAGDVHFGATASARS